MSLSQTEGHLVDPIAKQINDALQKVYVKEVFLIAGKHIQRDPETGVFRFLPGRDRQSLLNDVGTFTSRFVTLCRGLTFNLRVKETDKGGVSLDVTSGVSGELGSRLVERGG